MSLFTVSIFDYFITTQFSWIYELVIIALMAFLISVIIKNVKNEYIYSIIENEFIVKSIVGKREITIASMKFKQIIRFVKKSAYEENINQLLKTHKIIAYCAEPEKREIWVIEYKKNNKSHCVLFKPSKHLISILNDTINN